MSAFPRVPQLFQGPAELLHVLKERGIRLLGLENSQELLPGDPLAPLDRAKHRDRTAVHGDRKLLARLGLAEDLATMVP